MGPVRQSKEDMIVYVTMHYMKESKNVFPSCHPRQAAPFTAVMSCSSEPVSYSLLGFFPRPTELCSAQPSYPIIYAPWKGTS
jgi:hypothetical protein